MSSQSAPFPLESLPEPVLDQTLSYLTYHELAILRRVDRKFNSTIMRLLNQGFRSAERFHAKCLKEVKAKLPRRESERRNHKLSRHCDILTAIETRISLLSMTFLKYVDLNLCCFIPGKVIDEIISVLRTIKDDENPPRAYEILQELRDISSMAMEYFDDKIVPTLKIQLSPLRFGGSMSFSLSHYSPDYSRVSVTSLAQKYSVMSPSLTPTCSSSSSSSLPSIDCRSEPPRASRRLFTDMERISKTGKKIKRQTSKMISQLRKEAEGYKETVTSQNKKIVEMDKKIDQQNEVIQQQNVMIVEQMEKLAEMNRRMIESGLLLPVSDVKKEKMMRSESKTVAGKLIRKRSIERDSTAESDSKKTKLDSL